MKSIIPITPSTGGAVAPNNIIGRDSEVEAFWNILEKQGLALFAERRFGKSSILRKMADDNKEGFITIYKPVEGLSTIDNFTTALLDRVKELGLIEESSIKILEGFYNKAVGIVPEVKGFKFSKLELLWEKKLTYLFREITKQHNNKKIVFMLDEFSIFLSKLNNEDASVIIGFLRDIVHEKDFSNIRFVYCGSIGIDLVLDQIKEDGYNIGDPLNHMNKFQLETFTNDNALYFGKCLRLGCKLDISDDLIKQINYKADNIPYFIDVVFSKISTKGKISRGDIDTAFEEILDDTFGKESIKHFYDRIGLFYPKPEIAIIILNFISKNEEGSKESEIANMVLTNTDKTNRIEINNEITRLRNDGYLKRETVNKERVYNFKYSLLKLWWERNSSF